MDSKSKYSSIEKYHEQPLVSVIMTTYNVENYVKKAIDSILNQTYKKIELIIVDDNSTDNTIEVIKSYNDPRIRVYRNTINAGTYFCKNYGIQKSKGDFIAIQDSDDYSSPIRLDRQLDYFKLHPESVIVKCQYVRVNSTGKILTEPKAAFQASMIRASVYQEMGYYDTVRVAGDDEFDCRAKIYYGRKRVAILTELHYYNLHRSDSLTNLVEIGGPERITYVENFKKWHEDHQSDTQKLVMPYPHINRVFKCHSKIDVTDKNLTETRFEYVKTAADQITASVVSFPKRKEQFKKVVANILPQVDSLLVYLNGYQSIPDFLNHEKIHVRLGDDCAGDIADNGKFYDVSELKGFHVTIDDDIHYPSDYVSKLKGKLEEYAYLCVVGVHGIDILKEHFEHYYEKNSRVVYTYLHTLKQDKQVDILGTGTVAYHTNTFTVNYSEINKPFMVDIFFAIQVNRQKIPMICITHDKNWMKDYDTDEETKIYTTFKKNDDKQTELIKTFPLVKPLISTSSLQINVDKKSNGKTVEKELELNFLNDTITLLNRQVIELKRDNTSMGQYANTLQDEKAWYARTYDHLPKWYLKMGSVFRRLPINKDSKNS